MVKGARRGIPSSPEHSPLNFIYQASGKGNIHTESLPDRSAIGRRRERQIIKGIGDPKVKKL